jgi:hypothetical protein
MSPVQVVSLSAALTAGATMLQIAWVGSGPLDSSMLSKFILYGAALSLAPGAAILIPKMLPEARQSQYQHASFALYEVGFMGLVLAVGGFLVAAVTRIHPWLGVILGFVNALVTPAIIIVHALGHLRRLYGLSWRGALWRGAALSLVFLAGLSVATQLFYVYTIIDARLSPAGSERRATAFEGFDNGVPE